MSRKRPGGSPLPSRTPRLLNGDHLTVPEFERRYEATPEVKFAELIEGIVVMAPPVSSHHSGPHSVLAGLLQVYTWSTPGTDSDICGSLRLDGRNEYQPDVVLRINSGPQTRCKVAPDGLFEGSPELVGEVAFSSAGYDLFEKKAVYQRSSVREYFVWQVMDAQIYWFILEEGQYVTLKPRADGVICSRAFPGLWVDTRALLSGDKENLRRTLERGLKSAAHREFVKGLK